MNKNVGGRGQCLIPRNTSVVSNNLRGTDCVHNQSANTPCVDLSIEVYIGRSDDFGGRPGPVTHALMQCVLYESIAYILTTALGLRC